MQKSEIQNLIKELVEKTGVAVSDIVIAEDMPGSTWFRVEVSEPHFFIGHDGEALHALNHIVRRIIESRTSSREAAADLEAASGERSGILVDINGFQKKRVENIRAIAHMMGERARYFKSSIEIDPMSAFDRRIVHEFLADATDLKTESIGFGPARRVVIKYVGNL